MFCIFYYLILSCSTWWEFNIEEFPELVSNSTYRPILALCYSTLCPHCKGLPELLKNYSDTIGNTSDVIYTTVNCQTRGNCRAFNAKGTPHIVFIQGNNPLYWPVLDERTIEGWDLFIKEHNGPNLKKIDKDFDFDYESGGTLFHLEIPSDSDPLLTEIRELSRYFRIYNDSFVYKIASQRKLTAFPSKYCSYSYNGNFSDAEKFINEYKFGSTHKYSHAEYLELVSKNKTVLIINEKSLLDVQMHSLLELPKGHCSFSYGWTPVEDDAVILKTLGLSSLDVPFLYISDLSTGCEIIHKKRMRSKEIDKVLLNIEKGKCVKDPHIIVKFLMDEFHIRFVGCCVLFNIAIIFYVRYYSNLRKPQKLD